jgi:hypothetical protein
MKKYIQALLIMTVVSAPAFGEDGHEHKSTFRSEADSSFSVTEKKDGHIHKSIYRSMLLSDAQKKEVHEHLKEMQDLMKKIKLEKNIDERQILLDKHMKLMSQCSHVMTKGEKDVNQLSEKDRNDLMIEHMEMMEVMMGQMNEHNIVESNDRIHRHKKILVK